MTYKKIFPLGKRPSKGGFDDFYSTEKYKSLEDAYHADDFVKVDFVTDENDIVYFEFYNVKNPDEKKHHRLEIQRFPFGIDVFDDQAACTIAPTLF